MINNNNILKILLIIIAFFLTCYLIVNLFYEKTETFDGIPSKLSIGKNDKYEEKDIKEIEKILFGDFIKKNESS